MGFKFCFQDKLRNLVESSVNECPQSLFIFDEIDKMPAGILDTLKPYFDFYEQLGGTDYRKAMFIFLRYCSEFFLEVLEVDF